MPSLVRAAAGSVWRRVFRDASMLLIVIRVLFLFMAAGLGAYLAYDPVLYSVLDPAVACLLAMLLIGVFIALDAVFYRKQIATISAIFFGLLVGLILANLLHLVVSPIVMAIPLRPHPEVNADVFLGKLDNLIYLLSMLVLCYLCISLLLQTKDDFRFIIPYVEFARRVKGLRPLVLDTSVIIDGRIADICQTKMLDNTLIVPRFVLQELHTIADSADRQRRNRGRRGLDVLNQLRENPDVDVDLYDVESHELDDKPVDHRLVALAKELGGKVVTNDVNLNKIASLQGVEVINLNDLANALKPAFLPGDSLVVTITKQGEEAGQGVGYLDDGTMVVVDQGRGVIGQEVRIQVTSILPTSAGRMIFGKLADDHNASTRAGSGAAHR